MKKLLLFFMLCAGSFLAKAQNEFVVDPNAEVRELSGSFTSIKVSDGIDLYISQSTEQAIAISASEEKYKESIKTVIENGVLKISFDGEKIWCNKNKKMRAYVSFKDIQKLQASGASDVYVSGEIKTSELALEFSGASDFKGKVNVSTLKIDLSGASDLRIEGVATIVKIESSGASDVKGFDLITDICTAKVSGASDINITVNKELNAHASGASDVTYKGDGVMKDVHSSGASSIGKRGS
jgi:hypothetical protein